MQTVAIIDYGSGNLRSAARALAAAAERAGLDRTVTVTDRPDVVAAADRIVLPGVGAFADCRAGLTALDGMVDAMAEAVRTRGRPFLGICVGMQLMAERGLEHGVHEGLGWLPGSVVALEPGDPACKVPHMGWNGLSAVADHPVLAGLGNGGHVYFVHSYRFQPAEDRHMLAESDHGGRFAAVVGRGNLIGTQFHPEKSQLYGLRLIANVLDWRP